MLTTSQVWHYENGQEPGISRYIALCVALGVPLESLLPLEVQRLLAGQIPASKMKEVLT
jgi:hypothetical protein